MGRSATHCFRYLDYNKKKEKRVEADTSLQTLCPDVKPAGYEPHTEALLPKPGLTTGNEDVASTFPPRAKTDQMMRSTAQIHHSRCYPGYHPAESHILIGAMSLRV